MRTLWGAVCTGPGGDGARARARKPDPERKPHKIKREPGRKREKCMERCVL